VKFLIVATVLVLAGIALYAKGSDGPSENDRVAATALLLDRGQVLDVDLLVQDGVGQVITGGMAAAPLENWFYPQIANAQPLSFCFQVPQETADVTRQALNEIWTFFDPSTLPPWYETNCADALFRVGDTATADCGMAHAIGCFTYRWDWQQNRHEGTISYSSAHYPQTMNLQGVYVVMAHELGHLFGLGHTTCDWPDISVLSGIFLPGGPACAGGSGPVIEDYDHINRLYPNLKFRGAAQAKPKESHVQKWTEASKENCPNPSGDWCILSVPLGPVQYPSWFTTAIVLPDGTFEYPGGFDLVQP